MGKLYDLSGLNWVIAGNLLQILLCMAEAYASRTGQLTDLVSGSISAAGVAASILMITGLLKTARYSPALQTAKTNLLAAVLFSVIAVLLTNLYQADESGGAAEAGAMAANVLTIAAAVAAMISMYKLFQGCREIAEDHLEDSFAEKCRKGWYAYLILFFAGIAAGAANGPPSPEGALSVLPLILNVAFTSTAKIAVCFIVFATFRNFHGKECKETTGDRLWNEKDLP